MLSNNLSSLNHLYEKSIPPASGKKSYSDLYLTRQLYDVQLNLLIRDHIQKAWSYIPSKTDEQCSHLSFMQSILKLSRAYNDISNKCTPHIKDVFHDALRAHILSYRPHNLTKCIFVFYYRYFNSHLHLLSRANQADEILVDRDLMDVSEDEIYDCNLGELKYEPELLKQFCEEGTHVEEVKDVCQGWSDLETECTCQSNEKISSKVNEFLQRLNIFEELAGPTVMLVCRSIIERRVAAKGRSNYSCSYLNELSTWVRDVLARWISRVYGHTGLREDLSEKLQQFLRDVYAESRVAHMFEIIVEYPNSEAAIQDLRSFLEQTTSSEFRQNMIDSVKQSLVESLLHPGVNTYDILTAYISAIKALRALDPTGLVLQLVTEPVRRYLKSRADTVRCIVTALTDEDNNSELNREMIKTSSQNSETGPDGKRGAIEMNLPNEGEKCTVANFEQWRPDSLKVVSTDDLMKSSRFSDIVSILVNIYSTKDLFVEEYQKLLSQRLLNKFDECTLDSELRNLELLTLRFSDCELHRCEVMLRDVQTSKRVNKRILSGDIREHKLKSFKDINALIISSPFWPSKFGPLASLTEESPKLSFPPEIEEAIETYTVAFEAIQASRTLFWRHHLGTVNMDITVNGRTSNHNVSPLHASLIYLFKSRKCWRLNEIQSVTSLPALTIRSRLDTWKTKGIIRDCGEDKYELNE